MDRAIQEIDYKGHKIEIHYDDMCSSPRIDRDNFCKMLCFHNRYDLGDTQKEVTSKDFSGWSEIEQYLLKKKKAVVVLPLYLYDHSGLRLKVGSFNGLLSQGHAEFDSGQVGFAYCTKEDIRNNFLVKHVTKLCIEQAQELINNEVSEYDSYLSGACYGYKIFKGEEEIDSCWGFIGDIDDVINEAKNAMQYYDTVE